MCCLSQRYVNVRQTKNRTITLAILICFITVSLLSEAFILTHAGHTHDHNEAGGTCSACIQIQNAENLLKQLGTATLATASFNAGLFSEEAVTRAAPSYITLLTPIKLKIRMNN